MNLSIRHKGGGGGGGGVKWLWSSPTICYPIDRIGGKRKLNWFLKYNKSIQSIQTRSNINFYLRVNVYNNNRLLSISYCKIIYWILYRRWWHMPKWVYVVKIIVVSNCTYLCGRVERKYHTFQFISFNMFVAHVHRVRVSMLQILQMFGCSPLFSLSPPLSFSL